MRIQFKFFADFRGLFGGRTRNVDLPEGRTVGQALELVCDTPARREAVFDKDLLRTHLVVMVNGTPIGSRAGLGTALGEGDVVAVFPMLGGG